MGLSPQQMFRSKGSYNGKQKPKKALQQKTRATQLHVLRPWITWSAKSHWTNQKSRLSLVWTASAQGMPNNRNINFVLLHGGTL